MRTDELTDDMTKLIIAFRNSANAPEKKNCIMRNFTVVTPHQI